MVFGSGFGWRYVNRRITNPIIKDMPMKIPTHPPFRQLSDLVFPKDRSSMYSPTTHPTQAITNPRSTPQMAPARMLPSVKDRRRCEKSLSGNATTGDPTTILRPFMNPSRNEKKQRHKSQTKSLNQFCGSSATGSFPDGVKANSEVPFICLSLVAPKNALKTKRNLLSGTKNGKRFDKEERNKQCKK